MLGFAMKTLDRYQAHVNSLAAELGCEVRQEPHMINWGMMYVEFNYVEGPIITDVSDYLILLHELGHFALGHTQGRPPKQDQRFYFDNGVLRSEAEAWNWALDRSSPGLAVKTRRFIWDVCLGSYYKSYLSCKGSTTRLGNGNRHHVAFVFDHPDSYFADTVRRIQGSPEVMGDFKINYTGRYDSEQHLRTTRSPCRRPLQPLVHRV
jgi:hypothetical protein